MPREDGTGPDGKGGLTGRRMGKCEGAIPRTNFSIRGLGRRMGRGRRHRGR